MSTDITKADVVGPKEPGTGTVENPKQELTAHESNEILRVQNELVDEAKVASTQRDELGSRIEATQQGVGLFSASSNQEMIDEWNRRTNDAEEPNPVNGKQEIIRKDFTPNQYWEWKASEPNKAVYSNRDVVAAPKSVFNKTDDKNAPTMKVVEEEIQKESQKNIIPHDFAVSRNVTGLMDGTVLKVTVPETTVTWGDNHNSVLSEVTLDLAIDNSFIYIDVEAESNNNSGWNVGVRGTDNYNHPTTTTKRLILCYRRGSRLGSVYAFTGLQRLNRDGDLDSEWVNDKDAYNGMNQQEVNASIKDDLTILENDIEENKDSILDNLDLITKNKKQTDVLNSMQDNGVFYRSFDGSTNSYGTLDQDYTLSVDGDYIEFVAIGENKIGSPYNLGAFGKFTDNGQLFGWYNHNTMRVRGADNTYQRFENLEYSIDQKNKYKLEVINGATEWQLSINDTVVGVQPKTADFTILNIANSYSNNAIFDLFYLKIHNATKDLEITDFYNDNIIAYKDDAKLKYQPDVFRKCFVEFKPNGSGSIGGGETDLLSIVVHSQSQLNKKKYASFVIDRYFLDETNVRRTDYYRITGAYLSEFDGVRMIKTDTDLLSFGESEFVYGRQNRFDLSGGIHGNEYTTDVQFLVDNLPFTEITKLSGLTPCDEFSYIVKSNIHTPPASDGTPVAGYPVESVHIKHTTFKDGGYITYNKVTASVDIADFTNIYQILVSVSSDIANKAQYIGQYTPVQFVNDNVDKLIERDFQDILYINTDNTIATKITVDAEYDNRPRVRVKDSSTQPYCKYYYDISFDLDWTDQLLEGESFEGTGKIEFLIK